MTGLNESNKLPILQVDKITKQFGYRQVLDQISLDLNAGELTLLLGKNGAGKTTLLKIIAGLVRPSAGEIRFRGKEITGCPEELRRAIGVISHATQFYGELTARENLAFFAKLRKIKDLSRKISTALEETGLRQFADFPVKTFSSGMYKRLNIARLMVCQPQILLLDEPYSGLDLDSIRFFNDYIETFKAEGGCVLLISHQIDTCFDHSDRVAIIDKGAVNQLLKSSEYSSSDITKAYQSVVVVN